MATPTPPVSELDRRLARLMAGLDARPGFEARLAARLAGLAPMDAATRARAREAALEAHRAAGVTLRRALRRQLVLIGGTAASVALPAWSCGRLLGRALGALPAHFEGTWIAATSVALVVACIWAAIGPPARGAGGGAAFT